MKAPVQPAGWMLFYRCGNSVVMVLLQDIEQDSQTTLERKTLRRAFYSREAKNLIDDDDDGRRKPSLTPLSSYLSGFAPFIFEQMESLVFEFGLVQRTKRRRKRTTTCPPPRSEERRSPGG